MGRPEFIFIPHIKGVALNGHKRCEDTKCLIQDSGCVGTCAENDSIGWDIIEGLAEDRYTPDQTRLLTSGDRADLGVDFQAEVLASLQFLKQSFAQKSSIQGYSALLSCEIVFMHLFILVVGKLIKYLISQANKPRHILTSL